MNPETIARLCAEALQRIGYWINRSAGQNSRAIRAKYERARSDHAL